MASDGGWVTPFSYHRRCIRILIEIQFVFEHYRAPTTATAIPKMNISTKCWSSESWARVKRPSSSATSISSSRNTTGPPSALTLPLKSFTGTRTPSYASNYGTSQVLYHQYYNTLPPFHFPPSPSSPSM